MDLSPEKPKSSSNVLPNALDQLKALNKPVPNKEFAKMLLGIDEEDHVEEARSTRKSP